MVSHQLVEQWRARLAAWQQRLDEGRPRPWLARAYVRVLSYLLSQYAPYAAGDEPLETIASASPAEAEAMRGPSKMTIEVAVPEISGKPPRTPTEIRSVLEAVQGNVPRAEKGPRLDGLQPDDPIVVAAFYRPELASGLKLMLEEAGIESKLKRFRRQTEVVLGARDLERAAPIIAGHAAVARDSSLLRRQYARAWSTKGARIGLCLGMTIAAALTAALYALEDTPDPHFGWVDFGIFYLSFVVFTGLGWVIGLLLGTIADG